MSTEELNGTAHPTKAPAPKERPAPTEISRALFWEVKTSDGLAETYEVTDEEILRECQRRGLLSDEAGGFAVRIARPNLDERDTDPPPTATDLEVPDDVEFAEVGQLPSERIHEIARARSASPVMYSVTAEHVAAYLDERLGRAP